MKTEQEIRARLEELTRKMVHTDSRHGKATLKAELRVLFWVLDN